MIRERGRGGFLVGATLAVAIVLGLSTGPSGAAPTDAGLNPEADLPASAAKADGLIRNHETKSGRRTWLLKLDPAPTARVFERNRTQGLKPARRAARAQQNRIADIQEEVADELPRRARVLFETHSVIAGLAVEGAPDAAALKEVAGVEAVYPITPKKPDNAYAMPFQGAAAAWSAPGLAAGQGQKIAIVDSGIDYTHANFGGPGTESVYETAHQGEAEPADADLYPSDKVIGGHDFVGDTYQPDPGEDGYQPVAIPDENPLDCGGHGSHVAGSAAGSGVTSGPDPAPYPGPYGEDTDFGALKIGPGMAPRAQLLAYKVFGCSGSTSFVTAAIDMAADPNGDGDPSDGADVINLSVGSDFGSDQDGDAVAANAAVGLGISVVASAGNASDRTDISGSPGSASQAITVANSQDAASIIDGTEVEIDGTSGNYGSTRSFEYDWKNDPDLAGSVVMPPNDNPDACAAFPPNTFTADQVVIVRWTDDNLECGSVQRSGNLAAAGAGGFIFGSNTETFSAGITGSAVIPGVLMVKSAADQIRAAIAAAQTVEVLGTTANSVSQEFPEDNDKASQSTSRGIHGEGNLKPDVAAVGASVFSAAVGTGSEGKSESGTSMSSPMVAGLAALVREARPDWSPMQVKADIMNTATHDITVNGNLGPESDVFSPVRVGAGRIDADQALDNQVLAYDPRRGAVSVSFGPVEVGGPVTLTRNVTVENTGSEPATYSTSVETITSVPGVEYTASPAELTVAPGAAETVAVTLSATGPAELSKTVDPTIGRMSTALGLPRETLAEAAGRLLLEPAGGGLTLRVPVYAAPRPAARMHQPEILRMNGRQEQTAQLELAGEDLGQEGSNGTGNDDPADDIFSIAAGFELAAISGRAPQCQTASENRCVRLPDERGADLKHVGYTSDSPYSDAGSRTGFFALSTHAPNPIPVNRTHFQVEIDVDGDREADLFLLNNRLVQENDQSEDVFVSQLLDPGTGTVDLQPMNGRFGDVDTALYDSDTLVMPFSIDDLEAYGIDPANPRINYGVAAFSNTSNDLIDLVGFDAGTGELELTANLFEPGVTVRDEFGDGPLVEDVAGDALTVTRNLDSYREDGGKGLMMVHFHNRNGNKSQVVDLRRKPQTITFTSTPDSPVAGGTYRPTVTGGGSGNPITLRSDSGACSVEDGTVTFLAEGNCWIVAEQAGNDEYEPADPAGQMIEVGAGAGPSITAEVSSAKPKNGRGWYRTPVKVSFICAAGHAPLAGECPRPVWLKRDGADQSVSRSVTDTGGASATASVEDIDLDRTRPTVKIRGVRKGKTYRRLPKGRCVARDRVSKVASCRLKRKRRGKRVVYVAKATDKAGNSRKAKVKVRLARR
jgi:subtilisin family serine protease